MRYYAYDLASGLILNGGYYQPDIDPATQGLLAIEADDTPHPDHRTKRVTNGELRDATPEEVASYDASQYDAAALAAVAGNPIIAAVALEIYARLIGHEPTTEEEQALFV